MQRQGRVAVALLFGVLLASAVYAAWRAVTSDPHWRMCGVRTSIDVKAGRRRDDWYFMHMRVWRKAKDTDLSRMYGEVVGPLPEGSWRVASSRKTTGRRAYVVSSYENALAFSDMLAGVLSESMFTDEARRKAVLTFLGLLGKDGDDTRAGLYVNGLLELSLDWHEGKRKQEPMGPNDLPPPPEPYATESGVH